MRERKTWAAAGDPTADLTLGAQQESAGGVWREARQRGRAWVPLVILVVGLVLLLYSMQLGSVTTSGYDLQRLHAERNEWRQRNEQLELELAKVQSLAWIEIEAVQRLGMQKAGQVTYLEVDPPLPPRTAAAGAANTASGPDTARAPESAARRTVSPPDVLAIWRGVLALIVPPVEAGP